MKLLSTNADTQCSQPRSCQRPLHIISHPRLSHSYTLYQGAYLLMHILRDNIGLVWWRMCMSKQCQWLGSADLNRTIWLVDARTNISPETSLIIPENLFPRETRKTTCVCSLKWRTTFSQGSTARGSGKMSTTGSPRTFHNSPHLSQLHYFVSEECAVEHYFSCVCSLALFWTLSKLDASVLETTRFREPWQLLLESMLRSNAYIKGSHGSLNHVDSATSASNLYEVCTPHSLWYPITCTRLVSLLFMASLYSSLFNFTCT